MPDLQLFSYPLYQLPAPQLPSLPDLLHQKPICHPDRSGGTRISPPAPEVGAPSFDALSAARVGPHKSPRYRCSAIRFTSCQLLSYRHSPICFPRNPFVIPTEVEGPASRHPAPEVGAPSFALLRRVGPHNPRATAVQLSALPAIRSSATVTPRYASPETPPSSCLPPSTPEAQDYSKTHAAAPQTPPAPPSPRPAKMPDAESSSRSATGHAYS